MSLANSRQSLHLVQSSLNSLTLKSFASNSADTAAAVIKKNTAAAVIKKGSGEGWEIWDRENPITQLEDMTCAWTTFRATNGETSPMCVHMERDAVSDTIKRAGRWSDCDGLTALWDEQQQGDDNKDPSVYIEIGANIGGCILQMLLTTNATILAFEPHPKNQFCVTSSLRALESVKPEYRDRVIFFPIGLGTKTDTSTIVAAKGNMGHSTVGGVNKFSPHNVFEVEMPVQIERLDDILDTQVTGVGLIKMDVEGFECSVMDGMPNTLQNTKVMQTEVAHNLLKGFEGCSDAILVDKIRDSGFDVFMSNKLLVGPPIQKGYIDVVARRKHTAFPTVPLE